MDDLLWIASVQAQAEASILNGGRELDFIAVAPIIAGGADGLHQAGNGVVIELADALERRAQVLLLGGELRLAGEVAPRASTADAHERTGRIHTAGGGLQHPGHRGARE